MRSRREAGGILTDANHRHCTQSVWRKRRTQGPLGACSELPPGMGEVRSTRDRSAGAGHTPGRGCPEAPRPPPLPKTFLRRRSPGFRTTSLEEGSRQLRSLSLIAKPEPSPGQRENRPSRPGHLPARACLGPGRQQGRAWMGTAGHSPVGLPLQLNCGFVLLYSCSEGRRAFSGLDRSELPADNRLLPNSARQHRLGNVE